LFLFFGLLFMVEYTRGTLKLFAIGYESAVKEPETQNDKLN